MILVFDLDDTLYEEASFVKSGFETVSAYLHEAYGVDAESSFDFMMEDIRRNGRGRIFDNILKYYGIFNKKNVLECLSVYRQHAPNIKLFPEADECLKRFGDQPLYVVTDGNKCVQERKLAALDLPGRVRFSFITHRYGLRNAKPSPGCFLKICQREKVDPCDVFYIGDDPHKDFVGINPLGFKTIRVLTGRFKYLKMPKKFEAHITIGSLSDLTYEKLAAMYYNKVR